jgi:alanine racemase
VNYRLKNNRAAHVTVSRKAIQYNLQRVRELTPAARIMAVIKANGYGHDMLVAADALNTADEFAVTCLDDLECLRAHGISKQVTLLSSRFDVEDLNQMSSQSVRPVIYDFDQLAEIKKLNQLANLDLWLKVDTGMGRLGFSLEDAPIIATKLLAQKGVRSVSAMTHLANADNVDQPSNQRQIKSFLKFCDEFEFKQLSILNSAGIVGFSESAQEIVRPGVILYGVSPQLGTSAESLNLKAAMEFKSELISVKRLPAGSPIGYGSNYALDSDSRIGVISCGYADGYPRHAPNGTPVLINGMIVPLIGRVSMDLITVDLGDVSAEVGDLATLWGVDNPVEKIAKLSGTIAYELLCGVTARVERIVI